MKSDGDVLEAFELQPHALSRLRVLIVEDNPHVVDMYRYVVKKVASLDFEGRIPIDVDLAADGYHALDALLKQEYQLVLTDLYMPVMDGFALVERIRSEPRLAGTRVLAISGGGREAGEQAIALGADVFLRKPVQFESLRRALKKLLQAE
jgi:CheY-like chemotaxis protein